MTPRFLVGCALVALTLTSCKTTDEKPEEKPPGATIGDQGEDVSFQAFLSRLRKAAARGDSEMMARMMTPNFGFSWAPDGEGPGVFSYWNTHRLWPEVNLILQQRFVPSGEYMVSPPEVVSDPNYGGYRAGLRLVNGSWRFAYFVPAPPPDME